MLSKAYNNFFMWIWPPLHNFWERSKQFYVNFQKKKYHFIVYTYFCKFLLPMYSAVYVLSKNL